ncbi:hypothetical protein QBC45DRAFT_297024, partial [Copromyces sp. CBS 386.78]
SRSHATARTGWCDATSRPSLSRGHLASAASPLHEKWAACHSIVLVYVMYCQKAERSNMPNLPPAASTKTGRSAEIFPTQTHLTTTCRPSTPIQEFPSELFS